MARVTIDDCLVNIPNRFELTLAAAYRARQLANGAENTLGLHDPEDKPTVLALREIAARRINQGLIDEVERSERERAEREALAWAAAEIDDDLSKGGDD